jgi:hypothetical protein
VTPAAAAARGDKPMRSDAPAAYDLIIGAIQELLTAGAVAGQLKPGLDPDDVLHMVAFLWRIDPAAGGADRAARMLDLVVDGLTPHT